MKDTITRHALPPLLTAAMLFAAAAPAAAQTGLSVGEAPTTDFAAVDPAFVDDAIAALPELVERAMERSGVPGVAVAAIHDGEVVFLEGFGVRELPGGAPVTPDTVFQIASVSKPIAATVAAIQVGKGVASWGDPVSRHLPGLRLSDDYVTRHATIGDFFAHRSGLPMAAGDELEDLGFDRATILERLALVPLDPFRISYHYANFGTTIAAEAVAAAAGAQWETLSEETLYAPLGMTSTSSRHADFVARDNRATLHTFENGIFEPLHVRDADAQSPAGGVSSSARDMTSWVKLILSGGLHEGSRILDADAMLPAITPQVVSARGHRPEARSGFYGFGFNVGVTPTGRTVLSHSGAFANGAATHVQMIPAMGLGIIILSNGGPVGMPEAIAAEFMETAQFGAPSRDWLAAYGGVMATLYTPAGDLAGQEIPADAAAPAPLETYAGTYENAYFGQAEVEVTDQGLVLALGPEPQRFALRHWDGDTFAVAPRNENAPAGSLSSVIFRGGGEHDAMTIEYLNVNGLGVWRR
ncbi:MAG TPA: serine hydrolase [Saliniramus sp.]|nr:serine hydrolase [Saliniramus sp.]